MRIFTAPEPVQLPRSCYTVFLAGSIEQGKARDWQQETIDALKLHVQSSDLVVLNPRRQNWEQDASNPELRKQIEWELDGLEQADLVFFYFQGDTLSPISLLELGKISETPHVQCIVVCEPSFWRFTNVDITARRAGARVVDTLAEGIDLLQRTRF